MHHGAEPYIVTWADDRETEGEVHILEWDVDPLTRRVDRPAEDVERLDSILGSKQDIVGQNIGFDVTALGTVRPEWTSKWKWPKTYDTLLAGHLLASGQAHDLTTMTLVYLGKNIQPVEDAVERETKKARDVARRKFLGWRIARDDEPDMPSLGGSKSKKKNKEDEDKPWKYDMWLPRALAKELRLFRGECRVVDKREEPFDVYIGRGSKWGNPFIIGKDGTREEVIAKYREWLREPEREALLGSVGELNGKTLGCFCKPEACHGDVLAEELGRLTHPWWTVTAEYATHDAGVTLLLWKELRERMERRGLWRVYEERRKLLRLQYLAHANALTGNRKTAQRLQVEFREESGERKETCLGIAAGYGYDLELPKRGMNDSLRGFLFTDSGLALEQPDDLRTEKGNLSFDKDAKLYYVGEWDRESGGYVGGVLPERSRERLFVQSYARAGKLDTGLGYMETYDRFMLPVRGDKFVGGRCSVCGESLSPGRGGTPMPAVGVSGPTCRETYFRLHPWLSPTATDTLRYACYNPNGQQISSKEEINLRLMFGPVPGREWYCIDAMNIELRINAYGCREPDFIALFERPNDFPYFGSNHLLVAHLLFPREFESCKDGSGRIDGRIFKERFSHLYKRVKNGNFATQYQAGREKADATYGLRGAFDLIKGRFSKAEALNQEQIRFARKHGYVETIPDMDVDPEHGYPLQCGRTTSGYIKPTIPLSYFIQGTACWVLARMTVKAQDYLDELNKRAGREDYLYVLNVHDEIVLDFPADRHDENVGHVLEIKKRMDEVGFRLKTPMPLPVSVKWHPETWAKGLPVG